MKQPGNVSKRLSQWNMMRGGDTRKTNNSSLNLIISKYIISLHTCDNIAVNCIDQNVQLNLFNSVESCYQPGAFPAPHKEPIENRTDMVERPPTGKAVSNNVIRQNDSQSSCIITYIITLTWSQSPSTVAPTGSNLKIIFQGSKVWISWATGKRSISKSNHGSDGPLIPERPAAERDLHTMGLSFCLDGNGSR